jgi:hypothetical protein
MTAPAALIIIIAAAAAAAAAAALLFIATSLQFRCEQQLVLLQVMAVHARNGELEGAE